jgi:hypothetical protein
LAGATRRKLTDALRKHQALMLPGIERMPLATLEKALKSGVKVIATKRAPSLGPGLLEQERDTPRIRELARGLKVVEEAKLGETLRAAVPPDFAATPEIAFTHRRTADAEIYFVW